MAMKEDGFGYSFVQRELLLEIRERLDKLHKNELELIAKYVQYKLLKEELLL